MSLSEIMRNSRVMALERQKLPNQLLHFSEKIRRERKNLNLSIDRASKNLFPPSGKNVKFITSDALE